MLDIIRFILFGLAALAAASPIVIRSILSLIRKRRVAAGKPAKKVPARSISRLSDNEEEQELSEPQVAMRRIFRMTRTQEEQDRWAEGPKVPSTVRELYATEFGNNNNSLSQKKDGLQRVRRLPPLKQAIAWAEILGKPISERTENSWD